ncbi:hypothetical protein Gotur_020014 [Gossypium turneri]
MAPCTVLSSFYTNAALCLESAAGEDYSEKRPVTWDVKAWARNFSDCYFEYTVRQGNSVAHALVEEGIRRLEDYF